MGDSGPVCTYVITLGTIGKHTNNKSFLCKIRYNLLNLKYE